MVHYIATAAADLIIGVIILAFSLLSLAMLLWTGIKFYEKRGILFILAGASILFSFLFEFVSNLYEAPELLNLSLLSHGFVILAGILLSASFYLSKRAIEEHKEEVKT